MTNLLASLSTGSIIYYIPMTMIGIFYGILIQYVKHFTNLTNQVNRQRSNQRDLLVLRRIIFIISLLFSSLSSNHYFMDPLYSNRVFASSDLSFWMVNVRHLVTYRIDYFSFPHSSTESIIRNAFAENIVVFNLWLF